jgi:uncharacterized protein YbjT (DUF2867 family)
MRVLVTGATGYIGGRVIPRLLDAGHQVRVLVRDADRLASRSWSAQVEIVEGNILDREVGARAVEGVDAAYYLIHSMCSGPNFEEKDRDAANAFADVAGEVPQVIYLGGILPPESEVQNSQHLRSRAEVGNILRERLPNTTEFRAGPIIGSGSASFEMVRYLTERLPVMTPPKWVRNQVQPIGVRNVLEYMIAALGREDVKGVIDIGGEVLTFKDMLLGYAEVRGLPRLILPTPVVTPGLAARWVALVTPILNCMARPLVRGIVRPVVADTTRARALFPDVELQGYRESVALALERIREENVKTRWSDALQRERTFEFEDSEGLAREVRTRLLDVPPEAAFRAFTSLGGDRGWLVWHWLWALRGFLDQLVGGPGIRRGRRHPVDLRTGEVLDFWRVEEIVPGRLMRLQAEMKVPGRAWLQFEAVPEDGKTRLIQSALFAPKGFLGWIYWYSIFPIHKLLFDRLIDAVAALAKQNYWSEVGEREAASR